jgi:hypothetical protein
MSAPRRLMDEGGTDLEMALLRSAKYDAPPDGALERAMVAVGVSGGIAGAGASAAAASGGMLKPVSGVTQWIIELLAWVAIGLIGGALFTGAPTSSGHSNAAEPATTINEVSSSSASVEEGAGASATLATNEASAETGGFESADAPNKPRQSARAQAPQQRHSSPKSTRPTLAEEVALLDSVRRSLATGDTTAALAALERHHRDFTGGSLGAEAAVLAIDAKAARGDRAGAARAAADFLAAYPRSPHASHIRAILSSSAEGVSQRADTTAPGAPSPTAAGDDAMRREAGAGAGD